jgi:hypothetical protein
MTREIGVAVATVQRSWPMRIDTPRSSSQCPDLGIERQAESSASPKASLVFMDTSPLKYNAKGSSSHEPGDV